MADVIVRQGIWRRRGAPGPGAQRARAGLPPLHIERVDISTDPALEARYGRRIPVFAVGEEDTELVTNTAQLREFLERALPTLM